MKVAIVILIIMFIGATLAEQMPHSLAYTHKNGNFSASTIDTYLNSNESYYNIDDPTANLAKERFYRKAPLINTSVQFKNISILNRDGSFNDNENYYNIDDPTANLAKERFYRKAPLINTSVQFKNISILNRDGSFNDNENYYNIDDPTANLAKERFYRKAPLINTSVQFKNISILNRDGSFNDNENVNPHDSKDSTSKTKQRGSNITPINLEIVSLGLVATRKRRDKKNHDSIKEDDLEELDEIDESEIRASDVTFFCSVLDNVIYVLKNKRRQEIIEYLPRDISKSKSPKELQSNINISKSALQYHLSILESLRLIERDHKKPLKYHRGPFLEDLFQ